MADSNPDLTMTDSNEDELVIYYHTCAEESASKLHFLGMPGPSLTVKKMIIVITILQFSIFSRRLRYLSQNRGEREAKTYGHPRKSKKPTIICRHLLSVKRTAEPAMSKYLYFNKYR